MASASNRKPIIIALLVIAVAAIGGLVYALRPGCNARLESCCLATSMGVFRVSNVCSGMKIRIVDSTGMVRAVVPVNGKLVQANLSLPSEGEYLVELVVGHRVVDKEVVKTSSVPTVTSVDAMGIWESKTTMNISLKVAGEGLDSCFVRELFGGKYYIRKIIVLVYYDNGTVANKTFTGNWPVNTVIHVSLALPPGAPEHITPNGIVVFVEDSLGYRYQARVLFQH